MGNLSSSQFISHMAKLRTELDNTGVASSGTTASGSKA